MSEGPGSPAEGPGRPAPRLERARPGDARALAELAASSLPEPWSEAGFAEELALPEARIWLARNAAGELLGYLAAQRLLDELCVLSLAVGREHRRRGLGRALLERALGAEPGLRVAHLEVRSNDAGAQTFYDRVGFRPVSTRRGFYPDGVDAVLLTRFLPGRGGP